MMIKRRQKKRPCAIDLFSGCGGLTLGLKQAGFEVLSALELDDLAVRTYKKNHKDVVVIHDDIRNVSAISLKRQLKLRAGELDLLAGCPPCQGFSTLRTRNGSNKNRDARNYLIQEMLRFVRAFRPKAVMMENVPRLIKHGSFRSFCRELRGLGYQCSFDVKNAALYGVPQRRSRLILLAGRKFRIPFANEARYTRNVRNAIGALSRPEKSKNRLHSMPQRVRSEKVRHLILDIPKNGGSRSDLPKNRQLNCHRRTNGFNDIYGRMAWDDVSPTITSGCFNPSKGRFLHPEQNRPITLREAALLQSFPFKYFFPVDASKEAVALMIGNALPPEFIRRHAFEIKRAIHEYEGFHG